MKKFYDLFNKLLVTSIGQLNRLSLMTSLLQRKTQLLDLTEFPTVSTDVLVALARSSSLMPIKPFCRTVFIPKTSDTDDLGKIIRQFLMARGVRQGCPASGFLFATAFDPIFRWLQESIIPRNVGNLGFLQPAQCAYASRRCFIIFSIVDVCAGASIPFYRLHCFPQPEFL